jgi:hypothetical protein
MPEDTSATSLPPPPSYDAVITHDDEYGADFYVTNAPTVAHPEGVRATLRDMEGAMEARKSKQGKRRDDVTTPIFSLQRRITMM